MLFPRRLISFVVLLGAVCASGCHTTPTPSAPVLAAPKTQTASATPRVSRHRDSALTTYNNPIYGLSFHYPRTYLLDDPSDAESDAILRAQQDLAARQPGAVLVSLITIPPDAYPNTTFLSGSLEFVVHPTVSSEVCQSFSTPDQETYRFGATPTQGILFNWRQKLSVTSAPGAIHRDYAALFGNTCYEFFLEVVTTADPDADPQPKPAVASKITQQLDQIIRSLQIQNPPPSVSPF